jgi:hypothetical protein
MVLRCLRVGVTQITASGSAGHGVRWSSIAVPLNHA